MNNNEKLIGLVDALSNLTLFEASQLVHLLCEKWGITENVSPIMVPAQKIIGTIEEAIEKNEFDLVLEDFGPRKIDVIKVVRQITNLGLKDAKTIVETPSAKILSAVDKEHAVNAEKMLADVGATVSVI